MGKPISQNAKTKLLQRFWMDGDPSVNNLFYIDGHRNLNLNPLGYCKLLLLEQYYTDLAKNYKNTNYYPSVVHTWLGMDADTYPVFLSRWQFHDFGQMIAFSRYMKIERNDQENFYKTFQYHYKLECYRQFGDNSEQLALALGVRKGTTQRKATMNRELEILGFRDRVKKENNCWVLY